MPKPSAPSFVRTLVPVAVGQLVAYAATLGIDVPDDVENALIVITGFVITLAYYLAVRFLEQKFPKLGVLLGWAATPDRYTPARERELKRLADTETDETPVPGTYKPKH